MTQDDAARIGASGASIDRRTATPIKRRKHIYPPEAQMAAEQAAAQAQGQAGRRTWALPGWRYRAGI